MRHLSQGHKVPLPLEKDLHACRSLQERPLVAGFLDGSIFSPTKLAVGAVSAAVLPTPTTREE